ncbi:stromal interaction molecule 1-like isoform X3 [Acanthaster planci]|uniref:Stromal interaction molecule 1-like isoform X3 n=1 Tax=Acanthaster planci TaxID=133434 RepID=A0A8B7XH12_ACAPL|nr:stromal interaction molecule 1-like isoform X3 [Acanthaster planci]
MMEIGVITCRLLFSLLLCLSVVASDQMSTSSESSSNGGVTRSRLKFSECAEGDIVCQRDVEKDMQGLEAIKSIHRQIDDDHNGNVDLSESDEFLRDELQYKSDFERQQTLHGEDKFISVDDLWMAWKYSEVYNWTVEQTVSWLCDFVELPQYGEAFKKNAIEGSAIPRLAINSAQFLTSILGITDPIHRQKISLKAMDVVLFGPPKPIHSYLKDTTLLVSLVVAVGGCWFAYVQHRYSQSHIRQMLRDMEGLQRAEDALSDMQEKLDKAQEEHQTAIREKQTIEAKLTDQISRAMQEAERLREARKADTRDGGGCNTQDELEEKLRLAEEELAQLRNALQEAERRLESGSEWRPPPSLQQWLQLTYEIEKKYYTFKRSSADKQLREAKDVVEKIRKKRSTFMGSFRIAHGSILDDVDARIVNARSALAEVTTELKERLHRWAMVEGLCDFNIVNNPGIHHLITTLGVTMPDSSTSSIGAAMVVGSLAHVEANAPMGLDECDEDMPPPPTYLSALHASSTLPRQSHTSSTLSLSGDQLGMKKSKSTNNIASYGSSLNQMNPSNLAMPKARTPSPRSRTYLNDPSNFAVAHSPPVQPEHNQTASSHSHSHQPQTLHVSQSENALASLVASSAENGKRHTDSPKGLDNRKAKKDFKKSSLSQPDGDTDSLEMEEEKKKKKRLRIPGLSSSTKTERLKTC